MAFDALANIYKRKVDDDEKRAEWGTAAGNNVAATGTGDAFTPMGANASAGTAGAPVSAGFVNWGTRYEANKEKAGKQAQGIHDKVTNQAEGARGRVQAGQSKFAGLMGAGTPTGPRTGPHGTRVEAAAPGATGTTASNGGFSKRGGYRDYLPRGHSESDWLYDEDGNNTGKLRPFSPVTSASGWVKDGSEGGGTRQTPEEAAADAADYYSQFAGQRAGKYAGLMGDYGGNRLVDSVGATHARGESTRDGSEAAYNADLYAMNAQPQSGEDFYFSLTPEQAAEKAKQGYTGPKDIKEAMGEEEYTSTQEDLRKAEEAAKLTAQQGGLAAQMDYTGNVDDSGMASLDEAMARTAGGDAWRALAKRYGGLSKELSRANWDSRAAAGKAAAAAGVTAEDWKEQLDAYEKEQAARAASEAEAAQAKHNQELPNIQGLFKDDPSRTGAIAVGLDQTGAQWAAENGYDASDIQEAWNDLTPREKNILGAGNFKANNIGVSERFTAEEMQAILAKLAAARKRRKGSK